jgi:signal transduction histidine kinase
MNVIFYFRRRLGFKIFLSYLVIILVGVSVLATTAEMVIPSAFERHMAVMADVMGERIGIPAEELESDLFTSFRAAVTEALALAALSALLVAAVASYLISRQVVAPVTEMKNASRRIAEGHYDERVRVAGDLSRGEQDELGQLALDFNQMANRLEMTESLRGQLIADVTHELRTPLTTIKGSLEGLMDGVLPAEAGTYQQIYQETDRLARLVNDLQELSRVEAGAFELNIQPVSVSEQVGRVVQILDRQFEEKVVSLTVDVPPNLTDVLADADRLFQVLLNLLGNALQYTPSGGNVTVSAKKQGEEINFAISDTGIGIPADNLPQIFTRFYRVDKSRSRAGGGSGIGLTIAKYLVEAHGGRIWADSEGRGKGSTFSFSLPTNPKQPHP